MAFPTMYIFMLEHPDFKKYDLSSLRTGIMAGSPCPIKVMRQVIDEMGMKEITISYGQTEASPVVTMTTTDDSIEKRVSTVGKKMPGAEVKITDPGNRRNAAAGSKGRVLLPRLFCHEGLLQNGGSYKSSHRRGRLAAYR